MVVDSGRMSSFKKENELTQIQPQFKPGRHSGAAQPHHHTELFPVRKAEKTTFSRDMEVPESATTAPGWIYRPVYLYWTL
jgi:hypothetical protein